MNARSGGSASDTVARAWSLAITARVKESPSLDCPGRAVFLLGKWRLSDAVRVSVRQMGMKFAKNPIVELKALLND